jgi:hypothetical protein
MDLPPPDPAPMAVPPTPPDPFPPVVADPVPVRPTHLDIGHQTFDASLTGLRAYLETTKLTNPPLYAQLAPDLERLESRATLARAVLIAGLGLGTVSFIYALVGRRDCTQPSINDPAFSVDTAAWDACNRNNLRTSATFGLLGVGSMFAGSVAWFALTPGRADFFDFVNKHNRLSPEPLNFRVGYDPARRFAYGGATLAF